MFECSINDALNILLSKFASFKQGYIDGASGTLIPAVILQGLSRFLGPVPNSNLSEEACVFVFVDKYQELLQRPNLWRRHRNDATSDLLAARRRSMVPCSSRT